MDDCGLLLSRNLSPIVRESKTVPEEQTQDLDLFVRKSVKPSCAAGNDAASAANDITPI